MSKSKRGVSIMVGYVLLIVIAISLAVAVYPLLKSRLPLETPECPPGTALSIEEAWCDSNLNQTYLTLFNRGLFNVSGAFIRFGELERKARVQINPGSELLLLNPPRPLGPGEITPKKSFSLTNFNIVKDREYIIEVQPAIYKDRTLIPCANTIVTQKVKCSDPSFKWFFQDRGDQYAFDGGCQTGNPCSNINDTDWSTSVKPDGSFTYYVNYTKPSKAHWDPRYSTTNWTIKYSEAENLSLSNLGQACWNQYPLQLRINLSQNPNIATYECYNGNSWIKLNETTNAEVFEEAMWWQIHP